MSTNRPRAFSWMIPNIAHVIDARISDVHMVKAFDGSFCGEP
jgi:hypothetical protein